MPKYKLFENAGDNSARYTLIDADGDMYTFGTRSSAGTSKQNTPVSINKLNETDKAFVRAIVGAESAQTEKRYILTESQVQLVREMMDEMASARDLKNIQGAKLTTHKEIVDAIMKFMNSGKFGSVLFVKTDNSLRQTNVRSTPNAVSAGFKGAPKYNPADYNLLLLYDNNKASNEGKRGSFIQARFEGWMIFKGGQTVYDFTKVNAAALSALKPEDQQTVHQTLQNLRTAGFNPIVVEPSAEPTPQAPEPGTDVAV